MKNLKLKIEKLHNNTMASNAIYRKQLDLSDIDFFTLFSIAEMNGTILNLDADRVCALKYNYEDANSIIMIYEINYLETNKRSSDKMMKFIEVLEDLYITIDSTNVKKENSVSYLITVKKFKKEQDQCQ